MRSLFSKPCFEQKWSFYLQKSSRPRLTPVRLPTIQPFRARVLFLEDAADTRRGGALKAPRPTIQFCSCSLLRGLVLLQYLVGERSAVAEAVVGNRDGLFLHVGQDFDATGVGQRTIPDGNVD